MSKRRPATYGYAEVADRLEEELGVRPALSTLRNAAAVAGRGIQSPPRITDGMPAPLPAPSRTTPAQFDRAQIERWLRRHPRKVERRVIENALAALDEGQPEARVVKRARAKGLSWRAITALLNEHDGRGRGLSAVHKLYGGREASGSRSRRATSS